MPDPIAFSALTPRFSLPFLVAGQAQKEFFVNESLARLDALLHPAVSGSAVSPPAAPGPGECWIVGDPATGDWTGHEASIACWDGTQWTFCDPVDGIKVWDSTARTYRTFAAGWQQAPVIAQPAGGGVIDVEARAAIDAILSSLRNAGLIS